MRYQNKFKQKDLFIFVSLLPGANRNVPLSSNIIMERKEMFLHSNFIPGANRSAHFVPIFPEASRNVPFRSNFYLYRKDLFQFDIEINVKNEYFVYSF
jgi:hypothetical protein